MALDPELINKVTWKIPSALTLVGSRAGDESNAMTTSWVTQLSMEPVLIGVAVDNTAVTHRLITAGGSFTVNLWDAEDTRVFVKFSKPAQAEGDPLNGRAVRAATTGAPVFARQPAVATLGRGAADASDPQFGELDGFAPVADVRLLADDGVVRVGDIELRGVPTPGHAAGGTSWTWRACDGDDCRRVVYADSLTAVSADGYRFSDHPDALARLRDSFDNVAALDCEILVTPHPAASALWTRLGPDATRPLADPGACRAYADAGAARLAQRLAREAGTGTTP